MNAKILCNAIVELCNSIKAIDTEVYDYSGYYYETDYMIVCTGTSVAHNNGIAENVEFELKQKNVYPDAVEGKEEKSWILIDYGSVVLHIFEMDRRSDIDMDTLLSERLQYLTRRHQPAYTPNPEGAAQHAAH